MKAIVVLGASVLTLGGQTPRFLHSQDCSPCHFAIPAPAAAALPARLNIAPLALWQGSLMAHAAVDPYFQAQMRREIAAAPEAGAAIEAKCLRCHAPMSNAFDALGRDGVSCTVCHQIRPENLGTAESFSGGFRIEARNELYGPHANPFAMPMRMFTGFTPAASAHIREAALCGTCHTLITHPLDQPEIEFPEQTPYLEWLASAYPRRGRPCQSCHVPELRDASGNALRQYIAHNPMGTPFPPTSARSPFGLHFFDGPNVRAREALMPLVAEHAPHLEQAAGRARKLLEGSLRLEASAARSGAEEVALDVTLYNLAGHKLPTAYPLRRMWLVVTVHDAAGNILFRSGGGGPGAVIHRDRITTPEETAVFGTTMVDTAGAPTDLLLRAAAFQVDNRLLPQGWTGNPAIEARGVAEDADFVAGQDTVHYRIPVAAGQRPARIEIEALYQGVGEPVPMGRTEVRLD